MVIARRSCKMLAVSRVVGMAVARLVGMAVARRVCLAVAISVRVVLGHVEAVTERFP
jgi:hypothetical protein